MIRADIGHTLMRLRCLISMAIIIRIDYDNNNGDNIRCNNNNHIIYQFIIQILSQPQVLSVTANDCDVPSFDHVCIREISHALQVDSGILKEEVDVKLHFAIGVHTYTQEEIFAPNTYKNFLGKMEINPMRIFHNMGSCFEHEEKKLIQYIFIQADYNYIVFLISNSCFSEYRGNTNAQQYKFNFTIGSGTFTIERHSKRSIL